MFEERTTEIAEKRGKSPIFDGIVNEEAYKNAETKILWVLKEANSTGEVGEWDLRGAIDNLKTEKGIKNGWEKTFRKIVYVTNGIINGTEWDDIPYTNEDPSIIDVLKKIAYINIKKVGGISKANDNELLEYYNESKDLLIDQINAYSPDVIIFGNTYRFFQNDLGLPDFEVFGTCHAVKKSNVIYIDAYHPGARINEEDYFKDIIEAYNRFRNVE
ncbi:hypothetical protein GCM10028791_34090 [Echinicola sediminis]